MEHIEITPLDVTNSHIIELWDGGGRFLQSLWDLLLEFTGELLLEMSIDILISLFHFRRFALHFIRLWYLHHYNCRVLANISHLLPPRHLQIHFIPSTALQNH